jgi:hypothetical protein
LKKKRKKEKKFDSLFPFNANTFEHNREKERVRNIENSKVSPFLISFKIKFFSTILEEFGDD